MANSKEIYKCIALKKGSTHRLPFYGASKLEAKKEALDYLKANFMVPQYTLTDPQVVFPKRNYYT